MRTSLLAALALLVWSLARVAAQETTARAQVNPLARLPLERFTATRDQPLFSPSRRPPPPPAVATRLEVEPPPPEPPNVVLVGVLTDERGTRAFVRLNPMDKVRAARIGDDLSGWKVAEIEPTRIVLAQDRRTKAFAMFEARRQSTKTAMRKTQR
ncbi:hypothetical protein [Methylosinus sporium]|nr:hypothetical protein [Methylosinus sporium]